MWNVPALQLRCRSAGRAAGRRRSGRISSEQRIGGEEARLDQLPKISSHVQVFVVPQALLRCFSSGAVRRLPVRSTNRSVDQSVDRSGPDLRRTFRIPSRQTDNPRSERLCRETRPPGGGRVETQGWDASVARQPVLLVRPSRPERRVAGIVGVSLRVTGADGKRVGRHLGLGSTADFTLAEAREKARKQRQLLAEGVDPLEAKRARKTAAKLAAAKAMTFLCGGRAAGGRRITCHGGTRSIASSGGPRSRARRASRLRRRDQRSAGAAAIDTALALKVLEPIWKRTPETASRVRQRCEKVIDWASARGFRTGQTTRSRWRGHLDNLLPQPKKVRAGEAPPCPALYRASGVHGRRCAPTARSARRRWS